MSDLSVTSGAALSGRLAGLTGGLGGMRSFADVLASARPVGPKLDLPSDPIPSAAVSQTPYTVPTAGTATVPTSISNASLPDRAQQWLGPIADAAQRHGIDAHLLTALVWTESAFRPDAVGLTPERFGELFGRHFPGGLSDYLAEVFGTATTYSERPFAGSVSFEKFGKPGKVVTQRVSIP